MVGERGHDAPPMVARRAALKNSRRGRRGGRRHAPEKRGQAFAANRLQRPGTPLSSCSPRSSN
jgi:hypothetical protein